MSNTNEVKLDEGVATYMGDGAFVVQNRDEYGEVHSVYMSEEDLRRLLAAFA